MAADDAATQARAPPGAGKHRLAAMATDVGTVTCQIHASNLHGAGCGD
jgi:hypothetical protein